MKNAKKIIALLISVLMVFSLGMTVFAEETTGSITVSGTTEGKTYDVYKIFDLTGTDTSDPADGTFDKVAYTIDSDWVNFFIGTGAPGAAYLLDAQPDGGSLNALTYNGAVYYINITEENIAGFAQDALAWCADNTPAADDSKVADGESVEFTNLELGYYLVYPQGATEKENGSICSLTSTIPDAEINVKATYPTIKKEVDDASVEVGQTVTFTVTGTVPDTTGYSAYTYKITDTMTEGLTFNDAVDNISVKFGDADITVPDTGKVTYEIANNGFVLNFDMVKYQDYVGKDITITYQAVVNDKAVVTLTENKVKLTYSNDPASDSTEDTPEINVPVYTSKIVIDKYDGANTETKLKDAKFVLVKKSVESESVTESFYKYTAATEDADAKVEWVSSVDDATVVITDTDGAASFAGLEDGTYYLRETASPEGYNLLTEDVEVAVTHTSTNEDKPIGVSVTSPIANNSGTVLPATGGIGTVLFIAIGAVLFIAAGIVLTTKKRLYNEG